MKVVDLVSVEKLLTDIEEAAEEGLTVKIGDLCEAYRETIKDPVAGIVADVEVTDADQEYLIQLRDKHSDQVIRFLAGVILGLKYQIDWPNERSAT